MVGQQQKVVLVYALPTPRPRASIYKAEHLAYPCIGVEQTAGRTVEYSDNSDATEMGSHCMRIHLQEEYAVGPSKTLPLLKNTCGVNTRLKSREVGGLWEMGDQAGRPLLLHVL